MLLVNSKAALLPITCIKVFNCPLSRAAKKLQSYLTTIKILLPICSLTLPVSRSLNRNSKQLIRERFRFQGGPQKGPVSWHYSLCLESLQRQLTGVRRSANVELQGSPPNLPTISLNYGASYLAPLHDAAAIAEATK